MKYICKVIRGVPYPQRKSRGDKAAPEKWTDAVIEQTKNLPPVTQACLMNVTFLLPPSKFPSDFPYGPDLDNLLKRLMDSLKQTIFKEAPGTDSCVVSLTVLKTRVPADKDAGVHIEVLPVRLT